MATFAVHRSIHHLAAGLPRCALLASRARRDYDGSELPVRFTDWRCSRSDETRKFAPSARLETRGSSLFGSGVSDGGRSACSSRSVLGGGPPVRSFGDDGSVYEVSSPGAEPEYDVVSNDMHEILDFEHSTASEAMYPMECEFIEESDQSFNKLQTDCENIPSKRDTPEFNKIKDDAEKMAITLLATRSFTTVELGKKLRGKKYPPDVIELVITELKCRGLLNDGIYAESFSQSRWFSSCWGPKRIRKALLQKGVSVADAHNATSLVFMDGDTSSGPQDMYLGMSKISMDRLFLQASKQWLRGQNSPLANRRARIVRWLQYRGFDWGVTNFILKKLESKYPP